MKHLIYNIFYAVVYVFSLLPMWIHYRLSDIIYVVLYHIIRYRRGVVSENMSHSFPGKTPDELKNLERRFYRFFSDVCVENVKLVSMRKKNVMKRMTFEGIADMEKALKDHDLVIVYLGHYGNWEYVASLQWWVSQDIRCAQLYSPLRSGLMDRLFYTIRSRYGGENIKKNESLRHIVHYRQNKQKAIIGFIADQAPKWNNIHYWMTFLNQDTPVFTGTERIAKKTNAAVFYGDVSHPRRGYYHCHFKLMSDSVKDMADNKLTDSYMRLLEKTITNEPAYWLWTHKRWKRQRMTDGTTLQAS